MSESNLSFIDFGAGRGSSFKAASGFSGGEGLAVDISHSAVAALIEKGIPAEQVDVLKFNRRNAAIASFAFDLFPELPNRMAFREALINIVRAARDYIVIQHHYFDDDNNLAKSQLLVPEHFDKKILFKPMLADYLEFVSSLRETLSICGIAVFVIGQASLEVVALPGVQAPVEDVVAPRTLRIVIGRKAISRFHAALKKTQGGNEIYRWETA